MKTQHRLTILFFLVTSTLFGQDYAVKIDENQQQIQFVNQGKVLLQVDSIKFNFIKAEKYILLKQSANNIQLQISFDKVPIFDKVEADPDRDVLITFEKHGKSWHIYTQQKWGKDISIYLKDLKDHFFGISEGLQPDNSKSPDLRGKIVNFSADGERNRIFENYASAWSAFYMSSNGYGSFVNTFAFGQYKFGINGYNEIYHQTGNLDWYLFFGNDGDEIIQQYYTITGSPKKVPLWSVGPTFWRDENKGGKDEVMADVKHYTDLKIPLASVFVDRPYSNGKSGWSEMDFAPEFTNPKQWIDSLKNVYNLRFMTWVGSCAFMETGFPGVLPGFMSYIDLTNPEGIKQYGERITKHQYSVGVVGHKMDRAEEYFPVDEPWYDKTPTAERRNKYIYLYAKVTDSIMKASLGDDNFNFARSAMHGTHPYLSAVWGGDVRASWDGLAANIANAVRCGFMGYSNWGTDVGGYLGEKGIISEELYYRWVQWGAWCGLFEVKIDGAGGKGEDRAPWKYSKDFLSRYRNASIERMQLVPYAYSALNNAANEGVLMKPLAYAYLNDPKTYGIWNEYLFGNDFLIAPVTNTDTLKTIYFPAGNWIDWYNPKNKYVGNTTATIKLSKEYIPVYVRENALFITGKNILTGNTVKWQKNLNPELFLHAYPGKGDFESQFTYVNALDSNKVKIFSISQSNGIVSIKTEAVNEKISLLVHIPTKVKEVKVNGVIVKASYTAKNETLVVPLPKSTVCLVEIKR
jgi:alpha-glucosidase (family GH31 glycosyl hydrolase)